MNRPDEVGNVTDVRTVHARLLERWNEGKLNRGHFYAIQKILEQPIESDALWKIFCVFVYGSEPQQTVWEATETLDPAKVYKLFTSKLETSEVNIMHIHVIGEILKTEIESPELLAILRALVPKRRERVRKTAQPMPLDVSDWPVEETFFNSKPPEHMEPENMPFWEIRGKVKTAIMAILTALALGGIGLKMCGESDDNDTPGIETKDPDSIEPDDKQKSPKKINPDKKRLSTGENTRLASYGLDFAQLRKAVENGSITQREIARSVMPSTNEAMGMFFSNKFREGKLQTANASMRRRNDPFAQSYRRLEEEANTTPLMRKKWHEIFARYTETFDKEVDLDAKAPIYGGNDMRIPEERELRKGHDDALDIFFTRVRKRGEAEIGPEIHAHSGGLVIAARGDWQGGQGEKKYRQGGLSPKAGNGVIIYNPQEGRYYYYAHMDSLTVSLGDIIPAGQVIGYGGNTGAIARKPGRGRHVHFEIHEMDQGGRNMARTPMVLKSRIDNNEISG